MSPVWSVRASCSSGPDLVRLNEPHRSRAHARGSAAAITMISLAFLTTWGQSGASGCRTINHWQLGARKPYGARLFGVFALVQIGFKFPFGKRRHR